MESPHRGSRILLEVCTDSVLGACDASSAGADRIELCLLPWLGGFTPSVGLLHEVLCAVELPVIALVRPAEGGFVYRPDEQGVMWRDASELLDAGAAGIATGALLPGGNPDLRFLERMRRIAEDRELVFHRAFDRIPRMEEALTGLASVGVDRILTSGGRPTALEGAERIFALRLLSGGKPALLPGGGVTPENAASIVRGTGCRELHGSFSSFVPGGGEDLQDAFPPARRRTDPERIRLARRALGGL